MQKSFELMTFVHILQIKWVLIALLVACRIHYLIVPSSNPVGSWIFFLVIFLLLFFINMKSFSFGILKKCLSYHIWWEIVYISNLKWKIYFMTQVQYKRNHCAVHHFWFWIGTWHILGRVPGTRYSKSTGAYAPVAPVLTEAL